MLVSYIEDLHGKSCGLGVEAMYYNMVTRVPWYLSCYQSISRVLLKMLLP